MKGANFAILLFVVVVAARRPRRECVPKTEFLWDTPTCVCNSTYCDDVERLGAPARGRWVKYTSSKDGLRLEREEGSLQPDSEWISGHDSWSFPGLFEPSILHINRRITYQTIYGFGAAFTDTSGFNLNALAKGTRRNVMKSYFGKNGIELNMGRVPIGGTDFSTRAYAYNMLPEDDYQLANFSLEIEDFAYKIPVIREAAKLATSELHLVASSWSPPLWMKTNDEYTGRSLLRVEHYQTYADYHVRFLEEYEKNNVTFWGISTGNEPMLGFTDLKINGVGFAPQNQARWIVDNFGPAIRNSEYGNLKILAVDDEKLVIPTWMELMIEDSPEVMDYIDGIASHWYTDWFTSPFLLKEIHDTYPDKFVISTESAVGFGAFDAFNFVSLIQLGSWSRAETYLLRLIENFNNWMAGWIDWNLVTDADSGGPSWSGSYCVSPIMLWSESGGEEVVKHPAFYALGHFSKFVPRGSRRVDVRLQGLLDVDSVAFLRPDGGITVVVCNKSIFERKIIIRDKDKGFVEVTMPSQSFTTVVYW